MGIHDIWLFIAAGFLLNITPGPDMALVTAKSAQHGARGGVAAALGIGAGCFVHIGAAALGISAILVTSAWAFSMLKWIGAVYLIFVGVQMIWASIQPPRPQVADLRNGVSGLRGSFLQGFLTNVLNPKVALFFLAFLPQFISTDAPSKVKAFIILGLIFNVTGTAWNLGVAWIAGRVATVSRGGRAMKWLERTIGIMFVGVGLRLAFAERQ